MARLAIQKKWLNLRNLRVRCSIQSKNLYKSVLQNILYTELFISPSGISELECATTKTDTAEKSISIGREFLQVFFLY